MKTFMPTALGRFQDSLDQLETEIRLTHTVLRRDLALMQADRLRREREEAAERQRLAAASSAKKNAVQQIESVHVPPTADTKPDPSTEDTSTSQTNPEQTDTSNTAKPLPPISTSSAPATDPLFDGTPATDTAQDNDFDLEAMLFGDIGGGGDNAHTQDNGNAESSNTDLIFNLNDNEPSLLRGLEDFAKSSGDSGAGGSADQSNTNLTLDFEMPDLPDLSASQPDNPPTTTAKVEDSSSTAQEQPTQNHANNADIAMNDDLEDLFNMDYENPETTEFDNAFFGFGES
jgi:hypothetical protein